ncbi:MAG TPA: PQQ-binding-like beta-propeller repeat protein [Flavobacterium sp.]|uniref:outer membrane protein assembly factor BamB family protein n=1 Tax=Flavobacterium sp. TaxID=239 RepID=UPI002C81031E|nr:PQQ-binding-like beta-propeller repeat protein [Flavobacterium sp.]HNP33608.1 PQQ-binding-like beta-propeller repeat protein [Flavobacterium sp.]
MKKTTLVMMMLILAGTLPATAQFGKLLGKGKSAGKKSGSFATVWESEFDNKASFLALSDGDGQYIIGTDDNSATVLDADGKTIWSGDYKKITTNKTNNSEYQYTIWKDKGGYLFLFDARKLGTDRVAVLDLATGKELWNSELYQDLIPKGGTKTTEGTDEGELETVKYIRELDAFLISQRNSVILVKANTGEKIWETNRFKGGVGKYIYDSKRNEIIMVNFKPTALGALFSGFKNQLVRINASNGDILWDATFPGTIEKELVTRRAIIDLWIKGDKIFMYLDGINVYDYNTGQKLWNVNYENDMQGANGGLFSGGKRSQIYRTIADPLFTDDAVYIVIFGGRDKAKYVEKHDLNSGKLIWASEKITGAFCIPNIYKANDKILLQVGGKVQVQEYRLEEVSNGFTAAAALGGFGGGGMKQWVPYIYWDYRNQKNSVLCIDDKTGQTAWRSERFDKRITDLILDENKTVFVGDGDEFYGYDIASGNQLFDVKHNDAHVGRASDVIDFDDKVVVLSEKGLAAYNKKDGSRAYASDKIKGVDYFYHIGDNYFLRDQRNSKNIIYGIDMTNGETKGSVQSKGKGGSPKYGSGIDITSDGEYIFAFKGKKVEKIKVNN